MDVYECVCGGGVGVGVCVPAWVWMLKIFDSIYQSINDQMFLKKTPLFSSSLERFIILATTQISPSPCKKSLILQI